MKNSKKLLAVGSVCMMAVLGWLTGVVLSAPPYMTSEKPVPEMVQLKGDLTDYIAEKFKKERVNGTLVDVAVQSPVAQSTGHVEFPYILAYNEAMNGEDTTSWIQATAVLEKDHNPEHALWHVVKILTQKETVTFASAATITPRSPAQE